MAVTITVNSNSYVTLEEANSILEAVFDNQEWQSLTDEQKKVCLVNATNKINMLFVKGEKLDNMYLKGTKMSETQEMQFPRDWETDVSEKIKMAQCYEALEICRYNYKRAKEQSAGVVSRSMESVSVTYSGKEPRKYGGKLLSEDAFNFIRSYLLLTYSRC